VRASETEAAICKSPDRAPQQQTCSLVGVHCRKGPFTVTSRRSQWAFFGTPFVGAPCFRRWPLSVREEGPLPSAGPRSRSSLSYVAALQETFATPSYRRRR
jgi:hypothetical protein